MGAERDEPALVGGMVGLAVVMTPAHHRLHHSRDRRLSDANYVDILPLWDHLLRSFRHPEHEDPGEVGVDFDPIPAGFFGQLLAPFTWPHVVANKATDP